MATELPKSYDPASVQTEVAKVWDDEKCFHAEPTDPGEPYSIVIPPPNVTAALHLGHALNNTLQDVLIRRARMQGKNTCWLPGTDHAGIATQTVVEKRVQKEEGKRRTDFEREEFVKKIQAWKDEYERVILGQLKAMGCSCDWDRTAFTMDEPRAKAVREAFFQLFKAGLIYRGKRLVNWDPVTLTALADDEVENEEIDGHFYYMRYPLCNAEGETLSAEQNPALSAFTVQSSAFASITVATTRPETMLGDTAVAINPADPRAAALKGMFFKLPIVNRVIPIIEDDYVVKPVQYGGDPADPKAQLATGFLKVTPAHDPNDYEIGRRHSLPVINVMAPDASISDKHGWSDVGDAGFLLGKSREEARKLVVKWFKEKGLLEDQKPYRHSVGHSYRSHVPIEPYLSDQWYCRVTDDRLAGAALRAMNPSQKSDERRATSDEAKLTFYPERYAKTYQTWHENIRDWCISRQLWWGHRIPVWTRKRPEGENYSVEQTRNYIRNHVMQGLFEAPEADAAIAKLAFIHDDEYMYLCIADAELEGKLKESMGLLGYVQDTDVLDTWFSSGLWPLSTLGWPEDRLTEVRPPRGADASPLAKWNPTSVLCTAREIITLWVSRMVMFNEFFLGQIPFKDVFVHAMIQDGHGQKMSKSLGNGVDPLDIIETHGTDAMRFTMTSMATNTQDVRMPVDCIDPFTGETFTPTFIVNSAGYKVATPVLEHKGKKLVSTYGLASGEATPTAQIPLARNTSSKFDLGRNFCNKMWNAARFAIGQIESAAGDRRLAGADVQLSTLDKWILSRFNRTVAECDDALANYRFDQYARACYDFFWRDFCDWYVEAAKVQFRDETRKASTALVIASVLDGSLRLMHPMVPFVTEKLWWTLNEVYPDRGIDGWINRAVNARKSHVGDSSLSERIILAQWPTAGKTDEMSEAIMSRLQELITAIRVARNDYKVNPKQVVNVTIVAPECGAKQIEIHRDMIESLATCKIAAIVDSMPTAPANTIKAPAGACEVYIEGLVDADAEKQRVAKRREELTKSIAALKGRLGNQGYIAKAPPHLVQQTQDQLAAQEKELAELG